MTQIKKHYTNLDLMKWICAILVIAIHVSPLDGMSSTLRFWMDPILLRIAVPFFFAMSGFGLFGTFRYKNGKIVNCPFNRKKLLKYLRRIGVLYFGWSIVYFIYSLPGWYKIGWWGLTLVKDYIIAFLFQGSHYHLWYLVVLIYAVSLLYAALRIIPKQKIKYLVIPLWLAECALTSYAWVGMDKLPGFVLKLLDLTPCPIHAVLRGVPLLAVGMFVRDNINNATSRNYCGLTVTFCILYVIEAAVLYFGPIQSSGMTYLVTTPLFLLFALQFLVRSRQLCSVNTGMVFRLGSTIIYCAHPLVIYAVQAVIPTASGAVQWVIVTTISILIGLLYGVLSCKRKRTMH